MHNILYQKYFPDLTDDQLDKLRQLSALYPYWNERINVISRKDIQNLEIHHILHSLSIAKIMKFKPDTKILDVGTGGGFPGIPLAILFPEVQFTLIDLIAKKIKVVNEITTTIGLQNVCAFQKRSSEINGHFDFVVSRAVTSLPAFIPWIENKISKKHFNNKENGLLYIKGGDVESELKDYTKYEIFEIKKFFDEPFFDSKKVIYMNF